MTVERKPGLREPLCAACCRRLEATLGRMHSLRVPIPCACGVVFRARTSSRAGRPDGMTKRERRDQDERIARALASGQRRQRTTHAMRRICEAVALRYDLAPEDLQRRSQTGAIAGPRAVAMYLMRIDCDLSIPAIGDCFLMHHTSAMHNIARIADMQHACPALRPILAEIRAYLATPGAEMERRPLLPFDPRGSEARYIPGYRTALACRKSERRGVKKATASETFSHIEQQAEKWRSA